MNQLWHFWIVFLLYFHQHLYICSSSSSSSSFTTNLFEKWSQEHGQSYSSEQEKQYRIKILEENYNYITQHNRNANSSYTLSLNAFADLTHSEFKAKYLLERRRPKASSTFLDATAASKPVSIKICGGDRAFQFYSKGVFTVPCCNTTDHEVLIMGYDSRNGVGYVNVKNSWGIRNWGINGYMQLAIWSGNSCENNNMEVIMNYIVEKSSTISRPNLLSQPPPPSYYSPHGSNCFPFYCDHGATCCCYKRIKVVCSVYGCCDRAHPVCCKANRNCCDQDTPMCDKDKPMCYGKSGNASLAIPPNIGGVSAMLGS